MTSENRFLTTHVGSLPRPGDLIEMFSDGVDDDANGYTDDICGWDFYKNDNNPYDDTRYGHGTGEAKDSTAEANNGDGDPGVCPLCRFVPLRVGDSFIADVNAFGKAVIYAAGHENEGTLFKGPRSIDESSAPSCINGPVRPAPQDGLREAPG